MLLFSQNTATLDFSLAEGAMSACSGRSFKSYSVRALKYTHVKELLGLSWHVFVPMSGKELNLELNRDYDL